MARIKRGNQRDLDRANAVHRRSSLGLKTAERNMEAAAEQLGDVSGVLIRNLAQKESILRLVAAAEERLGREKEAQDMAEQDLEFADSASDKQDAEYRLRSAGGRISEIAAEIRQRKKTAKKIDAAIADLTVSKSRISKKIKKQAHNRPALKKLVSASKRDGAKLSKKVAESGRREESARTRLQKTKSRLSKAARGSKKPARKGTGKKPVQKGTGKKPARMAQKKPGQKSAGKKKQTVSKRRAASRTKKRAVPKASRRR